MKVTCKYCGVVDKPHHCPHKARQDNQRKDKRIYRSASYQTARAMALDTYNYVDLWELYVNGRYQPATLTHHIIEVLDDPDKAADQLNLFPTSAENHADIHDLYKLYKDKVQNLLFSMYQDYQAGNREPGKYKSHIDDLTGVVTQKRLFILNK